MACVSTGLSCSIVDGQLQILCDGSRWTVPRELVERSPILVDTLQSTDNYGCDSLAAPAGYLESYLAHVSASTHQVSIGRRNESNGSLTRFFQAADYFADEAAMQELCRLLGSRLFEERCPDDASAVMLEERKRTDDKILKQLPSHLLEYVIRESPASLDDKLESLPKSVHHLAILATFPTITTNRFFSVDAKQFSPKTLADTFRAISSPPIVQRLRVSNLHLDRKGKVLKSFIAFLDSHSSLQELAITDWTNSPAAVHAICTAVGCHTELETLELTHCDIDEDSAKPITQAVSQLRNLRHLTIRQGKVSTHRHTGTLLTPVLAQLSYLTHLDLGNKFLSSEDLAALSCSLVQLTDLQHLNLCACYMKHEGARTLAPQLANLTKLTVLKFANNMLQCAGVEALAPAFACLPKLQLLDLRRNCVCLAGVRALCHVLPGLTSLQHLLLGSNSIGSAGSSILAPAILHLGNLLHLDMSYNRVRNDGMLDLMRAVARLTGLHGLNLAGHAICRDAMTGMVAPAISNLHNLKQLDLELSGSCPLKECAQSLASALLATPMLTSLYLGVGPITNTPASLLAPAFSSLKVLESLELTYPTMTDLGAKALAKGLGSLESATKLVLQQVSSHEFGPNGLVDRIESIAPAIGNLTSLQHLSMAGVHMNDLGARALSNTLFDLGELRVLLLSSNAIGDAGLEALAAPISCLPELEHLELTDCMIGDKGAMSLSAALAACSKIRWVELNNNRIGDRGAVALVNALSTQRLIRRLDIRCNEVVDCDMPFLQEQWVLGDDYH